MVGSLMAQPVQLCNPVERAWQCSCNGHVPGCNRCNFATLLGAGEGMEEVEVSGMEVPRDMVSVLGRREGEDALN